MITLSRRGQRGAALATAMLLTLILLTLGLSFLTFCQSDLNFQRHQQLQERAENLALAGVEYWNYLDNKSPPAIPPYSTSVTKAVVVGAERFILERLASKRHYLSRGQVLDSGGNVIAERTIVVVDYGTGSQSYDR